ncbi:MAG: PEP/pyruvate-binding domain-containing protein [Alistipes onderdonkii]
MQDIEFTIQDGKLWMLQCRNGKRTGAAMVKIAMDMLREGLIDERTAVLRCEPAKLDELLHPYSTRRPSPITGHHQGPASPGAATGPWYSSPRCRENLANRSESDLRIETSPKTSRHARRRRHPHRPRRYDSPRPSSPRHGQMLRIGRRELEIDSKPARSKSTASPSRRATGSRSTVRRAKFTWDR